MSKHICACKCLIFFYRTHSTQLHFNSGRHSLIINTLFLFILRRLKLSHKNKEEVARGSIYSNVIPAKGAAESGNAFIHHPRDTSQSLCTLIWSPSVRFPNVVSALAFFICSSRFLRDRPLPKDIIFVEFNLIHSILICVPGNLTYSQPVMDKSIFS